MSNNKTIVKNTLFLYVRMFLSMVVSLYTARVVLNTLGATDYGIYNIIGGVIVLFSFLNSALSAATQRFLNFYLGNKDYPVANSFFCMSINVYIILGVLIVFLAETIGLWFVNNHLNIPTERIYAANWVFQFTIGTFVLSVLRIPYHASILAYERMDFYAYISIGEVLLKLAIVYMLYVSIYDKLIVYSILNMITTMIISIIYYQFSKRHFEICSYKKIWNKDIFRKLFGFTGWSMFGSIATMSAQQGLNILINIFYGVSVNAAVGIANQVCANVNQFVGNFQVAFRPQIIKNYASGEFARFYSLIFSASKFSFYMMFLLSLPIMLSIDSILEIWLVKVPEYTGIFCQLIMVTLIIEAIAAPLWMSVEAKGKIKNYQILMSSVLLLNFPLAYIVLQYGLPVYCVWCVKIVVTFLVFIVRCWYIKRNLEFPFVEYYKQVIKKIVTVALLSIPIPMFVKSAVCGFWTNLISVALVSISIIVLVVYFTGLNKLEKEMIKNVVLKKISCLIIK